MKSSSFRTPKPWYHHLTIDLIVHVLSRSVFHPAITLIFYLCLAAVHKHRQPLAHYTLYYTALLAVVEMGVWLDHRVAYGRPRKVDWEKEVVVITGGGSGLGRVVAEMLARRGVKVAVLDVKEPDEEAKDAMESEDLIWEVCDVSRAEDVRTAARRIQDKMGTPTILINNAAAAVTGWPLVPSSDASRSTLSPSQASHTVTVNTISHFNTLSAFLPFLTSAPNGGTVVTISSILAHLGPASLSDYAASKAAASSLHHTLMHEIHAHADAKIRQNLKTVLVEPGQLDTQLFSELTTLPWYANFLGPVLEAKDVAKEIVRVLGRGDGGVIRMPFYAKWVPWYAVAPSSIQAFSRWFSGIDSSIVVGAVPTSARAVA